MMIAHALLLRFVVCRMRPRPRKYEIVNVPDIKELRGFAINRVRWGGDLDEAAEFLIRVLREVRAGGGGLLPYCKQGANRSAAAAAATIALGTNAPVDEVSRASW